MIDWELIAWFGQLATRLARPVYAISSSTDEPCGFSSIAFSWKGPRINILGFCRPYVCVVTIQSCHCHWKAATDLWKPVSVLCFSKASPSLKFKFQANCHKNNPLLIFFFHSSIFDFFFFLLFIFFNVWKKILSLPAKQLAGWIWPTSHSLPTYASEIPRSVVFFAFQLIFVLVEIKHLPCFRHWCKKILIVPCFFLVWSHPMNF